jgi:hypothetical protein
MLVPTTTTQIARDLVLNFRYLGFPFAAKTSLLVAVCQLQVVDLKDEILLCLRGRILAKSNGTMFFYL